MIAIVWRKVIEAWDGRTDEAIAEADALRAKVASGFTWPETHLYIALLDVAAGRNDFALDALEDLEKAGFRDYRWIQAFPPLDRVADHPRFEALIRRIKEDVARQKQQVLQAPWLPSSLRNPTGAPPEE